MTELFIFGSWVCLFVFRTYVATGVHGLLFSGNDRRQRTQTEVSDPTSHRHGGKQRSCDTINDVDVVAPVATTTVSEFEPSLLQWRNDSAVITGTNRRIVASRNEKTSPVKFYATRNPEQDRLKINPDGWKKWGPYLSDRQWSTVREDYSLDGSCWEYFSHDDARARVYHSGEDGLLGLTDERCLLCFGVALWNEHDPILKERLFGLTGPEGNHGEDCKECVYYLDSTPTHSYMKALYKYPQSQYPYHWLVEENSRRTVSDPEFELADTGVFTDNRYWDVTVEYAKESPQDILIRIVIANRGPDPSTIHFIPQLWYRNTWSLERKQGVRVHRPSIHQVGEDYVLGVTDELGSCHFFVGSGPDETLPALLFTNNETHHKRKHKHHHHGSHHHHIHHSHSHTHHKHFKDAFHEFIINGDTDALNTEGKGSKFGAHYKLNIPSKKEVTLKFKLSNGTTIPIKDFGNTFDKIFKDRIEEADAYYKAIIPSNFSEEEKCIARQGYAGLLWNKQFYHFNVGDWLKSGHNKDVPPMGGSRRSQFSENWSHLQLSGVFSVADKWEYPWLSNWHLGFNVAVLAHIDYKLAMNQLDIVLRRENIGIDGELPSCEFNFSDVNPPSTAWAVWKVYDIAKKSGYSNGMDFLKISFQALTFQFKQWLSKKDSRGLTILGGGCFQMNNIGCYDCDSPNGQIVEQTDQILWSFFYCQNSLRIAYELIQDDPDTYDEIFTALCESYLQLLKAIKKNRMWSDEDGFFYNYLRCDKKMFRIKVRSIQCLVPLFGCLVLQQDITSKLPLFQQKLITLQEKYSDALEQVSFLDQTNRGSAMYLMSVPTPLQLKSILKYMLDEDELLSPYGIRSLSKYYESNPYPIKFKNYVVRYAPGDSRNYLFGGNNNWSGPIWIHMNYLIISSLEEYYTYFGDDFKVEFPTRSGKLMNLLQISKELCERITNLFIPDKNGRRPCHGNDPLYATDEHWKNLLLFHESFDGDSGKGGGASHTTGWTALVIDCMMKKRYNNNN